jgi:hypothetical protein
VNGAEVLRADGSGRFRVDGAITIESAPAVLASGSALLADPASVTRTFRRNWSRWPPCTASMPC